VQRRSSTPGSRVDSRTISMWSPLRRPRRALAAALAARSLDALGILAVAFALSSVGCSRDEAATTTEEPDAAEGSASLAPPVTSAAPRRRIADAGPPDARAAQQRVALADAGRFCGAPGLPDCPLQRWMKESATPILEFGEITAVGDIFDAMVLLAPPRTGPQYPFPYWASISRDGADAARHGDLVAARAACRGCHAQYLEPYRAQYRALPLPASLLGPAP
jgi:hypothetical protein